MVSIARSNLWEQFEAAEPQSFRSLRVIPLVGRSSTEPPYRLFDEHTAGEVDITEVSEGGSVPDVRLKNRLGERLLLIDGQELLGAKQNRILNTDVLVGAGTEIVIPVSCVEAGRWGYSSPKFSSGKLAMLSVRANKSSQVHAALRASRGYRSNQGAVWDDIAAASSSLAAVSSTGAMSDAYRQREPDLAAIRAALSLPPETIGVAVYHGERFVGLDLFDRAATFAHYWKSILDSYSIDWLAFGEAPGDPEQSPPLEALIDALKAAPWERFDAPGEGSDLRWESDELTASALAWNDDELLHLQAFPRSARPSTRRPFEAT